jgi:tetratricopeptide (TPR) repeat protein
LGLALMICLLIVPAAWADGLDLARKGLAAQRAGDFDKAIGLYTKAIDQGNLIPPDFAVTITNRGDCHRAKGEVTKAVADYRAAIKAAPDVFSGYNSLA